MSTIIRRGRCSPWMRSCPPTAAVMPGRTPPSGPLPRVNRRSVSGICGRPESPQRSPASWASSAGPMMSRLPLTHFFRTCISPQMIRTDTLSQGAPAWPGRSCITTALSSIPTTPRILARATVSTASTWFVSTGSATWTARMIWACLSPSSPATPPCASGPPTCRRSRDRWWPSGRRPWRKTSQTSPERRRPPTGRYS